MHNPSKHYKVCLSVAGSDPSGGAGIQADLKTFSALGCYGATAITAITIQNTTGVARSVPLPAETVREQMAAVMSDLHPDALKIGMTANADIIHAIAQTIREYPVGFIVLDPIMVSSSGHRLLDPPATAALVGELMPLCTLVTPNIPELEALTGTKDAVCGASRLLSQTAGQYVLVKGGHLEGQPTDILVSDEHAVSFDGIRIATRNTHGTGCTLSSAIAAQMAIQPDRDLASAVGDAKCYVEAALLAGADMSIGEGHGPMNHFFNPRPTLIE